MIFFFRIFVKQFKTITIEMIYFISDHHWGHGNIINYENRPFASVYEMDEFMIESWNSVVTNDDEVYHGGDIQLVRDNSYFINILSRLNGKIHLIRGNHDWKSKVKHYKHLMESVSKEVGFTYEYNGKDYEFILSHRPMDNWLNKDIGSIHVHGHIHTNDYHTSINGNIINVSVEVLDYKPISVIDVIKKFYDV